MSISDFPNWERSHPNWVVLPAAPAIHSGGGLGLKSMQTDEGFRDKIREIDKHNPHNTLRQSGVKF